MRFSLQGIWKRRGENTKNNFYKKIFYYSLHDGLLLAQLGSDWFAHGTQADEKNVQGRLQYEQNLKVVFAYL